ncbi:hypothetical protein [Flavobacterium sp. WC2509]|uniref:hypothetical protein n=1 Tax=Flavobacterium sp. WC2509 TaxID=3461406 RepID=UPI004043C631
MDFNLINEIKLELPDANSYELNECHFPLMKAPEIIATNSVYSSQEKKNDIYIFEKRYNRDHGFFWEFKRIEKF